MGALEASFGTAPVLTAAFDSGAAAAGLSAAVEGPFAGRDGATFTPAVGEDGTLSWTNDKGLENPAPVNIMGPAGADGAPGPQGPQGEPGPAAVVGEDLYVGTRARLRSIDAARGNLQLFNAAGKTAVNAYATENGIGELDVHDADGAVKAALYANTAGEGVLKLKNAAGDAETLCHADIAALHGLPSAPVQMVRIWKNAAPSSGFANQSLAIDNLQDYDAIAISAQYYAGYGAGTTLLLPTTPGTKGALTVPYYYIAYRNVTVGENSLVFAQGEYRASVGGSPGADNSLIIPTEIYGYKGVC